MKLDLRLDADSPAPGRELTGHVLVLEGGRSRSLVLTVRFCERSPTLLSVPFSHDVLLHEGDLKTGQAIPFGCEIPEWATPGVTGKDGELFWELEAVSDEGGPDTRASLRFQVA